MAEILRQHRAKDGGEGPAVLIGIIVFFVMLALAIVLVIAAVACLVLSFALKALPEEHP